MSLAQARHNRRLPRELKGGGGGGGGSSATVIDPNNFVIPDDFIFFEEPEWPPGDDHDNLNELFLLLIEIVIYIFMCYLATHLYGKYQDRKLEILDYVELREENKRMHDLKYKPLVSLSEYD